MRVLVAAILLAAAILYCHGQAQYPRPRRPERLDTAAQIFKYLKDLREYYSVHGRGRWGKRQMQIAERSAQFKETPYFFDNANEEISFKKLDY